MLKKFAFLLVLLSTFSVSAVSKDNASEGAEAALAQFKNSLQPVAKTDSPYELIQLIGEQLFDSVRRAKSVEYDSKAFMTAIVEKQLMPFIDVTFASYKILGTQLKKSTKEERLLFVEAMKLSLVKTYSSALTQYDGQEVRYEPVKSVKGKKTVAIAIELIAADRPNINMTFKLRKNRKTEEWKAFDLVVEGISLVDSKRAELSRSIRQQGIRDVATTYINELSKS